jgi:NADH-quinone oxidoreductase subunit C
MDPEAAPEVADRSSARGGAVEAKEIFEKLVGHFGSESILGLVEAKEGVRDPSVEVAPRAIDKVCFFLRKEPELAFDFCQSLTALDAGEAFLCVYHLYSYARRHTLVLKTRVPRGAPTLPTVTTVWPAADWYEREAFDLFGVVFEGHGDLRRLLLPEDWEGHPMRKDYVEKPQYRGIPTTRESPLDLLAQADAATPPVAVEPASATAEKAHGEH